MTAIDTKQRILDVAEQQFAERGYAGTSLRAIIAAAGVNLAAVHYHFHSKEALLEAVIRRRADPLNAERIALLDACEKRAGKSGPSVEEILESFVGPPMRLILSPSGEGRIFGKLIGRLHAETGEKFFLLLKKHFEVVALRFSRALQRLFPALSREELFWRVHWAAGSMAHTLAHWDKVGLISGSKARTNDVNVLVPRLVAFLAAGFRAPAETRRPAARRRNEVERKKR
jgi:AcrR family transcriptional regulator